VEQLTLAFAHYDDKDVWRALTETMALFRWLSVEVAEELIYRYPIQGADNAEQLVRRLAGTRSHR
jgi:hypothetical protein